jgi:hypothetical protein
MGSEIVDSSGLELTVITLLAGLLIVIPIALGAIYRARHAADGDEGTP